MDYPTIKSIHIGSVALSYALFFVRGVWMMRGSALLRHPFVRTAPHVVDTVLLASAIVLAVLSGQYPLEAPWLAAKLVALVAYIGLGTVALRHGRTLTWRVAAWLAAQVVFAYIVMVAVTRSPWGVL